MKKLFSISLLFYTSTLVIPSHATSFQFRSDTLDHATKIILNDNVLIINHPECATVKSGVHFSPKQQNKETTVTLECAGKFYRLMQSDFIEKAAHEEVSLSDLVESK